MGLVVLNCAVCKYVREARVSQSVIFMVENSSVKNVEILLLINLAQYYGIFSVHVPRFVQGLTLCQRTNIQVLL